MTAINSKSNTPFNLTSNKPLDEAMLDNDSSFTANSATRIPTQQAVATAIEAINDEISTITSEVEDGFSDMATTNTNQQIVGKKTFESSATNASLALAGENPTAPVNGDIWISERGSIHCRILGLTVQLVACIFTQTKTVTVQNTTDLIDLLDVEGGVGTNIIPANFLVVGRVIRIKMKGVYSTWSSPVRSFSFRVNTDKTPGGGMLAFTSFTLPTSQNNSHWELEVDICVRQTGVAGYNPPIPQGAITIQGKVVMHNSDETCLVGDLSAAISYPFDTTVEQELLVQGRWTQARTEDRLMVRTCTIEVLN